MGTMNSPMRASITVPPENSTARLAVSPVATMASMLAETLAPLLAIPLDDEQGVVDADRQPDHHDHVHDEERLGHEDPHDGDHPDADADGHQGQDQRDPRRHEGAEHEHQHEHGDGQARSSPPG